MMAEYTLPPEMEEFAEACGDAAMGPFQAADFDADPSAAFSEGMGAAMEYMTDAGMPPDMMNMIQDICQGGFDAHMEANPDSSPMDAFDAVGGAVDMYLAEFPGDMSCMDMMDAGMPSMPEDMGEFMDTCPPYGDFEGGENFDAAAMPDTWEPGPMTDMGPGTAPPGSPPPGDMGPGTAPPGSPPPGDMGPGTAPPGSPPPGDFDMPEGTNDMPPPGDMGPGTAPPPDPLFGDAGPAGQIPPGSPPPGDMGPGTAPPGSPPPGDMGPGTAPPPDGMGDMHSHMDDASATHDAGGPAVADTGPMPGDLPEADMPPPSDDPNDGGEVA